MKLIATLAFLPCFCSHSMFADDSEDSFNYDNLVISLKEASSPAIINDYVVFTSKTGPGFVGIAFDFEEYKTIHPFRVKKIYDEEGKIKTSLLFHIIKRPDNVEKINYRLLIDGLWTKDPLNDNTIYDWTTGLTISTVNLGKQKPEITNVKDSNYTHFVYNGDPGQKVRLAGTFTKWDSWIYELEETKPGFYELTLPLPRGTYYYSYYIGLNSYIDKTNPNKAYTNDGKQTSVITVN